MAMATRYPVLDGAEVIGYIEVERNAGGVDVLTPSYKGTFLAPCETWADAERAIRSRHKVLHFIPGVGIITGIESR